jgi:hypothetical protein
MSLVGCAFKPTGWAGEFDVVLDQDAVVEDSETGGGAEFVGIVESRGGIDDVVDLPLSGGKAGVREGRILAVNGPS